MTLRKRHSSELKSKVAVAAIRGDRTVNEIAAEYEVHPNLVAKWKKQALEALPEIFHDGLGHKKQTDDGLPDRLYQEIGRLKVELDWLKKKTGYCE